MSDTNPAHKGLPITPPPPDGAAPRAEAVEAPEGAEEEERLCRYCFGDDAEGPLISPCECRGGQKYVHLECLRRWQRMILVSQPTHPAYQTEDERHHKCNVCLAKYTCEPPTRGDLMASFTGPEIAALVEEGCIIASRDSFSEYLEATRQSTIFFPRSSSHWIRGVYLITSVTADPDEQTLPISDQALLNSFRNQLDANLEISFHGRRLRITGGGSLFGVPEENRRDSLFALQAPATLVLASVVPSSFSDDHIAAVNLTNPIPRPQGSRQLSVVNRAVETVCRRYSGATRVELHHYSGGPCVPNEVATCIVPGGSRRGWTVKSSLEDAIILAHGRGARRFPNQGDIGGGQTMKIINLRARTDLNSQRCMTLTFDETSGRWAVMVGSSGECVKIKPDNLEAVIDPSLPGQLSISTGSYGRVFVFWGNAGWSRAQLLGEIAHGSWGLCRANVGDLLTDSNQRWASLANPGANRLAYAPVNEMTEDYVTNPSTTVRRRQGPVSAEEQQRQMESLRGLAGQVAATYLDSEESSEDEGEEGPEISDDEDDEVDADDGLGEEEGS